MTRRWLYGALLLLGAARADAFPIWAEGCYPPENATTATCNTTVLASGTGGDRRYTVMECSKAATSTFTCPFTWPASDPATLTPTVWWRPKTATADNVIWAARIACFASGDQFDAATYGSVVEATASTAPATATIIVSKSIGAVTPNKHAPNIPCSIEFSRRNVAGDTMSGNAYFRMGDLQ